MPLSTVNRAPHGKILFALLLIYALLASIYSLNTPLFEAPDAYYHFAVAEYIARTGERPPTEDASEHPWRQMTFHAPLYHLMAAGLMSSVDTSDWPHGYPLNPHAQIGEPSARDNHNIVAHASDSWRGAGLAARIARALNLLLGGVVIAGVYWLAWGVFQRRGWAALAVCFVLFNPQFLFMSGVINNDILVTALSVVILALLVHIIRGELRAWVVGVLALLLALAALAKTGGLMLYPVAALGLSWAAYRARWPWTRIAAGVAAIAGAFIIIAGWWYWGNWVQFGEPTASTLVALNTGPRDVAVSWAELRGLYLSFWGVFGWFNILAPDAFYVWTLLILALGFTGVVYGLLRRRLMLISENGVIALLLGIHALLLVIGWWSFNALVLASQGRLLFPLLATLGIVIAAGLRFFPRPVVAVVLVPMMLASVSFPFTRIAPVYAPAEQFSASLWDPSAELRPVLLREPWQDDGCALLWIGSPRADLASGQIYINAAWEARCEITGFWSVFVHLSDLSRETCEAGDTSHILAQFDSMPDGGNTPLPALRPGFVIRDGLRVAIPVDLDVVALADLHVQVGLYDAGGTFIRAFVVQGDDTMGAQDSRPEIGRCSPELVNLPLDEAINQPESID